MRAVVDWGRRSYPEAWRAMRALRAARRAGEVPDTLVLVEHDPVITVGVQGDDGLAETAGIPLFHVERGGHGTYHGPGQLVGYPIVDLDARGRDVRGFVAEVEELVIRAIAALGVVASRIAGRRGVWVEGERKIASVGIAVEEWVTFHGFALNVDLDLEVFRRFRPCGFDGGLMTSVKRELGRPVTVDELKGPVAEVWRALDPRRSTEPRERSGAMVPAS